MQGLVITCRVCGADFRPVRLDALTCTPTCAKRLQRGHAFAYLAGEPAKVQRAARAAHDAHDRWIVILKRNNASDRSRRAEKRQQRAEKQRQRVLDGVYAGMVRAQLAADKDVKARKLLATVASVFKLFQKEQRNDTSAAAVFAWIEGAVGSGRYTIEEVEAAIADLETSGDLDRIREEAVGGGEAE